MGFCLTKMCLTEKMEILQMIFLQKHISRSFFGRQHCYFWDSGLLRIKFIFGDTGELRLDPVIFCHNDFLLIVQYNDRYSV